MPSGRDGQSDESVIREMGPYATPVDVSPPSLPRRLRDDDPAIAIHLGVELVFEGLAPDGHGAGRVDSFVRLVRFNPGSLREVVVLTHLMNDAVVRGETDAPGNERPRQRRVVLDDRPPVEDVADVEKGEKRSRRIVDRIVEGARIEAGPERISLKQPAEGHGFG